MIFYRNVFAVSMVIFPLDHSLSHNSFYCFSLLSMIYIYIYELYFYYFDYSVWLTVFICFALLIINKVSKLFYQKKKCLNYKSDIRFLFSTWINFCFKFDFSFFFFLLLLSISFNSNAMVNLANKLKCSILEVLYYLLTRFGFLYKYVYICTYMCLYSWSNLGVSFWICIGNYL